MKKEDEIMKMFKWIEDHPNLGKVDVCIPNAGLSHDNKLIDGIFYIKINIAFFDEVNVYSKSFLGTMAEWRSMLDVNVLSLQLCTQLAVKSMLKVKPHYHHVVSTKNFCKYKIQIIRE